MPLLVPGDDRSITDPRNPLPQTTLTRMPQLKALTSVRAFVALYVGLYHMVKPFTRWGSLTMFMSAGYTGVSFFFLLSGFILTYTHGLEFASGKGDRQKFWVARFARVYPIYLVVMLWSGYVGRSAFHQPIHIIAFIADLFMMQAWSIRMVAFFNVVAWSLSVEAFFYLAFPFIVTRLRSRSLKGGILLFTGCYAACLAIATVGLIVDPQRAWSDTVFLTGSHSLVFALRRYPILQLPEFGCGIALGWIYLQTKITPRFAQIAVWSSLAGILAALALSWHLPFLMLHNGLLMPLAALLVLGLTQRNVISTVLSAAPMLLLGEASYSFYLLHFNFNELCASAFGWKMDVAGLLPRLSILVPLCICLHLWVERPARRLVLRWWTARKTRALIAA
jgi:peptidoglycan/LPS O-acetylase OafA/YrhL